MAKEAQARMPIIIVVINKFNKKNWLNKYDVILLKRLISYKGYLNNSFKENII
jgi:hypothetical protein